MIHPPQYQCLRFESINVPTSIDQIGKYYIWRWVQYIRLILLSPPGVGLLT